MSERNIHNNLRLDRVVASQPELGPSVPDGGYGWLILFASIFLQILIPSILASYGIFMLYSRIESSAMSEDPKLFDIAIFPTPIVFVAVSTLADPWSRTIVATSTWPRLVTTTGVFLICAGLLFQWIAMRDLMGMLIYMFSGALTGFGASLALTQSETLVSHYFRLKLPVVNNILICGYSFGFIVVPITLGFMLIKKGILHSLLIYQAVIFQCVVLVLVYKKPKYLKATRRRYEVLQNITEDDEMLFIQNDENDSNTRNATNGNTRQNVLPSTSVESSRENTRQTIETNKSVQETNKAKEAANTKSTLLAESYANEFAQDIGEITDAAQQEEPRPLYSDIEIANSIATYTFDNNDIAIDNSTNTTFIAPPERIVASSCRQELSFLWKPSFYKSLFFLITVKYTCLIFWILFPTYLYVEMPVLKVQQTTFLVGSMGLGSLFISIIPSFLPEMASNRQNFTAAFCFICSVGYFVLSDAGTEGWLLFGALLVTISITAHHVLKPSMMKHMLGLDCEKAHTLLHTLTGIGVLLFLSQDISYRNCFRIMALLQFILGFILISSLFIKMVKHLISR